MRLSSWPLLFAIGLCAACSGTSESTSTGGGGTGGSPTGGGGSGGTTTNATTTGSTSSTGGGGSSNCPTMGENVYDNAVGADISICQSLVSPLPEEDGTFSVTVFGPFVTGFDLSGFSFAAGETSSTAPTDPWTASVTVVPAGSDPLAIDPNVGAQAYPLQLIETLTIPGDNKMHRYSIALDTTLKVNACDTVVVALRNTVGPPLSSLGTCGTKSTHSETNQWWELNGNMVQMSTYGAQFDKDWWVSLTVAQ
ncbi:MAG: hypothetical protein IPK82_26885 [Polyangiaceae bacterium]|nr:hypothetical protein [Polyangiaceae bacterium]